ncbi:hypothetical protein C1O66_12990 [Paucibacter aquatile]|uniref:Uncharacterized protein n=2 Tax=Kinneretia aquatilis TaxID=2070761 RepID=A0A2N8KY20_9BURK|nr:hypothetical protein C1O66_12990 [Paucibacter aquatile]
MMQEMKAMSEQDRVHLNFENVAKTTFAFLNDLGFSLVESLPTLVRYQNGDVEISVFHGRRSYEIGVDILYVGTRYALAEIIRVVDPDAAKRYSHAIASTAEGVVVGLEAQGALLKRYGTLALQGDPHFFSILEEKRTVWADEYWLDGLAKQVRPQADEAFHRGDYAKAAELYARIRSCLSPAEVKKLVLAEERSKP